MSAAGRKRARPHFTEPAGTVLSEKQGPFSSLWDSVFHYPRPALQRNRERNNDQKYEATVSQKPGFNLCHQNDLKQLELPASGTNKVDSFLLFRRKPAWWPHAWLAESPARVPLSPAVVQHPQFHSNQRGQYCLGDRELKTHFLSPEYLPLPASGGLLLWLPAMVHDGLPRSLSRADMCAPKFMYWHANPQYTSECDYMWG